MPWPPVRPALPLAPRPPLRRLAALAVLGTLGGVAGHAPTLAHAATRTVTTCDKSSLDTAIAAAASGDTITFSCSGTITDNLTISKSLTLDATGQQVTLDGNHADSVITVTSSDVQLTLIALTLTHGFAGIGGGINNFGGGTLTLTNSTVSGNTAGSGGGIFNNGGTLTLTNSTVSGNTAGSGLGGGGIFNDVGTLTLTNSTVSGNTASGGLDGGGIYSDGTVTLINSTVSGNTAGGAGGIYNNGGATVTLRDTILAANTAQSAPDCYGTLTSGGYNLLGNNSGCAGLTNGVNGDQVGTAVSPIDPKLGPLQDNGGPTKTQALLAGSPAIDVVPPANLTVTTDQRSLARPDSGETVGDIGAYEVQDPATPCTGPSCQTNATPELGSGELLATGLLPLGLAFALRRRRARYATQEPTLES